MNLDIGSTVGDYEIVSILGAGGMGKVYKVRNVISDRIEAMKVLLPDLANAPDLADRFATMLVEVAELALLEIGFDGVEHMPLLGELGLELNRRGALPCGSDWQTDAPGVFVCCNSSCWL